jgi:hypothetical protein
MVAFLLPALTRAVFRKVPYLTAELLARGYSEDDVAKILGGNAIRVLAKVQSSSFLTLQSTCVMIFMKKIKI